MEPPLPSRIIDREVYLVTSRAPRALMVITLSNTAMSVSIGVAISPPNPPQFTTPHTSRSASAVSDAVLGGEVEGQHSSSRSSSASSPRASSDRPLAITSAPAPTSWRTVSPPMPPEAPVTKIGRPSKSVMGEIRGAQDRGARSATPRSWAKPLESAGAIRARLSRRGVRVAVASLRSIPRLNQTRAGRGGG